jgi:hypothetical protein
MQRDANWLCFDTCQTSLNVPYCAIIGAPLPYTVNGQPQCGAYTIRIRLRTCGTTNFVWLGSVNAFYTRNWQDFPTPGTVQTVWRFAINGDMLPTSSTPPGPCDKPACLSTYSRIYVSGYIDYALDCSTNTWQVAFVLSHECDAIHHQLGFSRPAPPLGFHPTRSFSIVCPGTGFTPYLPASGTPRSDGPITADGIRWNNWAAPAPQACKVGEPVNGTFTAQNEFCVCVTTGAPQYIATNVNAVSVCGSQAVPSAVGPYMQKRIGSWSVATSYPGVEYVLFDFGWLNYRNGCSTSITNEWFEGGETIGGFPAVDFAGVALGRQFEDLGSCNTSTTSAAVRIGAPHVANYLLYLNLP